MTDPSVQSSSDTDRPECYIPRCSNPATRELHFPSLDVWKPYCDDHTPLESYDEERSVQTGTEPSGGSQ